MKLNKRKAKVVTSAIDEWQQTNQINSQQAQSLKESIEVVGFDWRLMAVYSFWIAISCLIISVGVLLADDYLMNLLATLFDAPASVLCTTTAILAALCYYGGFKRRQRYPSKTISNEAIYFFGVLMSAVSVGILGETSLFTPISDATLLLIVTIIYFAVALVLPSTLVWIFALISFTGWVMFETTYLSDFGDYFLGLNHPIRLTIVGAAIAVFGLYCPKQPKIRDFTDSTQFIGLLFFLFGFWLLSIFGNHSDFIEWSKIKQIDLVHWAILSITACFAILYLGIHHANSLCRSFGITFLLINLYTRFFEYFWDTAHKTIFFAVLAFSFWLLGSRAEKLWRLGQQDNSKSDT
ncbi:hypothetical protein A3K86_19995 [Photobacterium jeanii]|uniref:DUF2157 domain-containing protein n=1 Tax=Photobacterium jeanii TaxID=858640 RepID=A0A178K3F3_9GAMM|nr:hypothetical protein [Photobacterium jeanii]OAN11243.1 hypothetical protein A3K86_19995 [Photobacterium jeanii]PST90762.1 hypothetical protein C9I91_09105 [Photobacterium jeanii]